MGAGAVLASMSLVLTGCAATGGGTGATGSDGGAEESIYPDAKGKCAVEPLDGNDYDTAASIIGEYQKKPDRLVVSEPLPEPIDPSTSVAFLNNGTAVAGLMWSFIEPAAKAAGVSISNVTTGTDAQSINTALNTVVETKPDIVLGVGLDPAFYIDQLGSLRDEGTVIVSAAITNAEEYDLLDSFGGNGASLENGRVLAAAAVARTCGAAKDFVFYHVPEFPFSHVQLAATQEFLPTICDDCELRVVEIPVATMDTTAGDAVVSDLQAHPETKYFVTPVDQIQIGMQTKMELAGIDVKGMGQSSLPPNIEQISNNLQDAGFAVDFDLFMWLLIDEGLRRHMGEDVDYGKWAEINPLLSQVLTSENAADYKEGFAAFPGFKDEFLELWGK
jgi:ribose transport system substrate-binding protein